MKEKDLQKLLMLKQDAKLAIEGYRVRYQKVPKSTGKTFNDLQTCNNVKEAEKLYNKFYGGLKASDTKNKKHAKWRKEMEE